MIKIILKKISSFKILIIPLDSKKVFYIQESSSSLGYLLTGGPPAKMTRSYKTLYKIAKLVTKFHLGSRKKTCSVSIRRSKRFGIKALHGRSQQQYTGWAPAAPRDSAAKGPNKLATITVAISYLFKRDMLEKSMIKLAWSVTCYRYAKPQRGDCQVWKWVVTLHGILRYPAVHSLIINTIYSRGHL